MSNGRSIDPLLSPRYYIVKVITKLLTANLEYVA